MTTPNKSLVLAKRPTHMPVPGEHLQVINKPITLTPPPGGLIVSPNYISYDPYLRGKMKPVASAYAANFAVGDTLYNNGLSTVVASDSPRFKKGDLVLGWVDFAEYSVIPKERLELPSRTDSEDGCVTKYENPLGLDPAHFVGALGMPGITAYSAIYGLKKPTKGDVVLISAASGAVGQLLGQLAKKEGAKVIGSVGSQKKLDFIIKELGFDAGFNYKVEDSRPALTRILKELGEEELSIYYDQVGGAQLDVVIDLMKVKGSVFTSGHISQSSLPPGDRYGVQNLTLFPGKRITYQGYLSSDPELNPAYEKQHMEDVSNGIKSGEIKAVVDITEGIDNSAEGLVAMLTGENFGKSVLKIADIAA